MIDRRRASADDETSPADEEALSALLDGALFPDEAERMRERLSREPALQRRFEAMQKADAAVRDAYRGIVNEPLPERVLQLLQPAAGGTAGYADATGATASDDTESARDRTGASASGVGEGAAGDTNVVGFTPRGKPSWPTAKPDWFTLPTALAAGVALVAGGALSFLMLSQVRSDGTGALVAGAGIVERGAALYETLQTGTSGTTREIGAQATATPRLTFVDAAGDYCRQVDVASAAGTTYALACRRAGDWRLELASFTAQRAPSNGLYRPAAGETPEAIDAAIDAMIDGAPLSRAEEQQLVSRGWMPAAR
jgi:anti-sigma factor RsiW